MLQNQAGAPDGSGVGTVITIRRLKDGTEVDCLAAVTAEHVDPMFTPTGDVLVLSTFSCLSRLDRIVPTTHEHTVVRQFDGDAGWASLSPAGGRLAVLGTEGCTPHCRIGPCGLDRLEVIELATWRIVSSTIKAPYYNLAYTSWSPDGSRLALEIGGLDGTFVTVDAAHPDLAHPKKVKPPAGCTFSSPGWIRTGILMAVNCRSTGNTMALIDPDGTVQASWAMPKCGGVDHFLVQPGSESALAQIDIGYGSGPPCGSTWGQQIWQVQPPAVRTITATHTSIPAVDAPTLAGWW